MTENVQHLLVVCGTIAYVVTVIAVGMVVTSVMSAIRKRPVFRDWDETDVSKPEH